MEFRRLLVPVDFSARSMAALTYAVELAQHTKAAVDVLHVWEPPAYVAPDMMVSLAEEVGHRTIAELARNEVSRELRQLLETYEKREDVTVHGRLEIGSTAETVVETAEKGNYDLIVMATHGRTGLQRLMLGSVTEQVMRLASCPVLTVPPSAEDD